MALPQTIALLRAAADAGQSVVLDAERCREIVDAVKHPREAAWARVDTETAAKIMAVPVTTARAMARRYWRMIQDGKEPPVRVWPDLSDTGTVVRWWFHEGDCWQVRRETGGGPRPVAEGTAGGEDLDEREATIRMWGDIAVGVRPPPPRSA